MHNKLLTTASAAVPASFLGREKELSDIRGLLTRQNTLVLVNAEGGMGKTTLAARYWQHYAHEYRHLAWLFCESGILSAMRSQLPDALGLREAMNQYADDPDKQVQVLKTAMANLPRECLLVLDNANDPEHIRGFQQQMAGLGWHVLITSRCSKVLTDATSEYPITGLPPAQAKELFKKNHDEGTPEFEALLDRFLHAVDRNTLCIEAFSKNLREGTGLGMTLADLLEKLKRTGLFLGDDSFEIQTEYAHNIRKEAVKRTDQVIEALYDVADLQRQRPELHDLLIALALLPAENYLPTLLAALLAPDDKTGLKRRLDQLAQKGWLATDTATYRISPVLQKILLHRNAERRWELGEPMVKRLHGIFESDGYHPKNIAKAEPFAELAFGLLENLGIANEPLVELLNRLYMHYRAIGNLKKAMYTAESMRNICEKNDFKGYLAISYEKLGDTYTALGNLEQALTFFERFNKLTEKLYADQPQNFDFKNGWAISYGKLGDIHTKLGNLAQALTFFEDETKLFEELYAAFPQSLEFKNGLAISYSKLGDTHTALGNLDQALTFFEKYNQLKKELYTSFPTNVFYKNGMAISCSKLGDTHTALGNLDKALTCFEEFGLLEKELHEASPDDVEFKNGLAISYSKLGCFWRDKKGDNAKAKTYLEQCHQLWKALADDFPSYAEFQNNLRWVEEQLSDLET